MVFSADTKTWRVDGGCANVDAMPAVTFIMGGNQFSLGPRQYIIQVGATARLCFSAQLYLQKQENKTSSVLIL